MLCSARADRQCAVDLPPCPWTRATHTLSFWLQRGPLTASPAHVNLQPGLGIIPTLFGLNNTSGEALKL